MKKFTWLILFVWILAACNEYTNVTEVVEPYTYTRQISVNREDWRRIQDENNPGIYHYCQVKETNLTDYIFDNGVMQAFLYDRGTMSPLPFSDFVNDENKYYGEEHFTVEFQPGYVTFILKTDYNTGLPYYNYYDFMIRFLW